MTLEERLENWARAVRFRCRRGHAMSFEGRYRSPQGRHWEAPVIPISRNINADDAWQVEAAWSTLNLADRVTLRCHYCLRWPHHRTARFLSKQLAWLIKPHEYESYLLHAQASITQALERSESQNRNMVRTVIKAALAIPTKLGYTAA